LQTQFDYYSQHEFFMHRIQHSVLHHISPFLIALARPGAALTAGFKIVIPAKARLHVSSLKCVNKWSRAFAGITQIMNNPIMAALLFCTLILLWLIPSIHFIAMLDWRWYRIMNWSMIINGLMFWNLVLNNYCLRPAHLSPACRIVMMLAIVPPQILIGMLIFAVPHELYPIYSICGRAFELSPLADQQMGGLILWIPAAMMSVIGMLVVLQREWLRKTVPRA
jgi:putative membrane protein